MYQSFDHSVLISRSFTINLCGKGIGVKLVKKYIFYKQKEHFPTFSSFSVDNGGWCSMKHICFQHRKFGE